MLSTLRWSSAAPEMKKKEALLTTKAIVEMTMKGIRAGSLISGSRMPLLRLVARMATQSESGPATVRPIIAPTAGAKLAKPTEADEKLYGGLERIGDSNRTSSKNALAAPAIVQAAQHMMGKKKISMGVHKWRQTSLNALRSVGWNALNCCLLGLPFPRHSSGLVICAWLLSTSTAAVDGFSLLSASIGKSCDRGWEVCSPRL